MPFISSETPNNLILYPSLFTLLISSLSMELIPSTCILWFIKELKHKEDNIFSFDATSTPFKSVKGFDSAYPFFFAVFKTSLKSLF